MPVTQDIRDGFALSYARDYETLSEGWLEATRFGETSFDRWIAAHDARVAAVARADAWHEGYAARIDGVPATAGPLSPDSPSRARRRV